LLRFARSIGLGKPFEAQALIDYIERALAA
jgi:hypothetical protein